MPGSWEVYNAEDHVNCARSRTSDPVVGFPVCPIPTVCHERAGDLWPFNAQDVCGVRLTGLAPHLRFEDHLI